jgi:hypothetical protein
LFAGRNVENAEVAELDALTDKVDVEFNMFGPLVVYKVGAHVYCRYVIAVSDCSLVEVDVKLAEELTQPNAFRRNVHNGPVLRFGETRSVVFLKTMKPVSRRGTHKIRRWNAVSQGSRPNRRRCRP